MYKDANTLKFYYNGKELSIKNGMFDNNDKPTYINVNQLVSIMDWTFTKGNYGKYDEV